jgi:hypothetical protein
VSLEDAFWQELKEIAGGRHMTLSDLAGAIDSERRHSNLSSAIRLFVLDYYRNQFSPPIGHAVLGALEHEGLAEGGPSSAIAVSRIVNSSSNRSSSNKSSSN